MYLHISRQSQYGIEICEENRGHKEDRETNVPILDKKGEQLTEKTQAQKRKELAVIALATDLLLSPIEGMNPNVRNHMDTITDGPENYILVENMKRFRAIAKKHGITIDMVFAYLVSMFHISGMVNSTDGIEDTIIRDYYGDAN